MDSAELVLEQNENPIDAYANIEKNMIQQQPQSSPEQQDTQHDLNSEFQSKSPSPAAMDAFRIKVNPLTPTEQPQYVQISTKPIISKAYLSDLPVPERRAFNVERRQQIIQDNHLQRINERKRIYELQTAQTQQIIEKQKLQSEVLFQRPIRQQIQAAQNKNADLQKKREEAIILRESKLQTQERNYIDRIIESKNATAKPQTLSFVALRHETQGTQQNIVQQSMMLRKLSQQQQKLVNQRANVTQKRRLNVAYRDAQTKKQQLQYIQSVVVKKQVENKELLDKIQAEKMNPELRKQKILTGQQLVEYKYAITDDYNERLKSQAIQLKEKYEKERFFKYKQKNEDKVYKNEKQKALLLQKQQNKQKFLEQLENDNKLEEVRFQNQLERQRVQNEQLKEILENYKLLKETQKQQRKSLKQSLQDSGSEQKKSGRQIDVTGSTEAKSGPVSQKAKDQTKISLELEHHNQSEVDKQDGDPMLAFRTIAQEKNKVAKSDIKLSDLDQK